MRENVRSCAVKREAILYSLPCEVNLLHFGNCHAETHIQGKHKEAPVFFKVRGRSHPCSFLNRFLNQCNSGFGEALEFQIVCHFRVRLTSIINCKKNINPRKV